jgi:3-hydroxymyristoyl/3-hydroxydecanoyl-(acyl carrier protein) dehydratase
VTPLPAYSELRRVGEAITLSLDLPRDCPACAGHFPATPILPAVAQVDWAIRLARENFSLPSHFSALRSLKFLRIVQPPVRLTLDLAPSGDGRGVTFRYTQGDAACSTGRIEFSDDAAGPDRSVL